MVHHIHNKNNDKEILLHLTKLTIPLRTNIVPNKKISKNNARDDKSAKETNIGISVEPTRTNNSNIIINIMGSIAEQVGREEVWRADF